MEQTNQLAQQHNQQDETTTHKTPDSAKFSFKCIPQLKHEMNSNQSIMDENISTKQVSEDANLVVQNRRLIAENIFGQANPFGHFSKGDTNSRTNHKDRSDSVSQQSDSEKLIATKKDHVNGSEDVEEDASIASKSSVSMDSDEEDGSPFLDYLQIGQEVKDIRSKPNQCSKPLGTEEMISGSAIKDQSQNEVNMPKPTANSYINRDKQSEFIGLKHLIGHPFKETLQKLNGNLGSDQITTTSYNNIQVTDEIIEIQQINQNQTQDFSTLTNGFGQNAQDTQQKEKDNEIIQFTQSPHEEQQIQVQQSTEINNIKNEFNQSNTCDLLSKPNEPDEFDKFDQQNQQTKGPKKPLSPYIFFSQEKRKELKKEHPDWNSAQIMKQVSILWSKMSPEQKRDFQDQSKIDRERFEKERQDYAIKKEQEPEDIKPLSVLDTVKQRSQIVKQQQEMKQKYEEYIVSLVPQKRTRKARKNSDKKIKEEAQESNDDQRHQMMLSKSNSIQQQDNDIKQEMQDSPAYKTKLKCKRQETSSFGNLRIALQTVQSATEQLQQQVKEENKKEDKSNETQTIPQKLQKTEIQLERERLVQRMTSEISVNKQSEQSTGRFQSRTGSSITQIAQIVKQAIGDNSTKSQDNLLTQLHQPKMQTFNSIQLQRQRLAQQQDYNRSSVNLISDLHHQKFMQTPFVSNTSLQHFNFTPKPDTQLQYKLNQVAMQQNVSPGKSNLSTQSRIPQYSGFSNLVGLSNLSNHNLISSHQLPTVSPYIGVPQHQYITTQAYVPSDQLIGQTQLNYIIQQQQNQQQIQYQPTTAQQPSTLSLQKINSGISQNPSLSQNLHQNTPQSGLQTFQYITTNTAGGQIHQPIQIVQSQDYNTLVQQQQLQGVTQPMAIQTAQLHNGQIAFIEDPVMKTQQSVSQIGLNHGQSSLTPFQSSIQLPTVPVYQSHGQIVESKTNLIGNSNINLNEEEFNEFQSMYLQRQPQNLLSNQSAISLNFAQLQNYHQQQQQQQQQHQQQQQQQQFASQSNMNLLNGSISSSNNLHFVQNQQQQQFIYPYVIPFDQQQQIQQQKKSEDLEDEEKIESHNDEELLQMGKAVQRAVPRVAQ